MSTITIESPLGVSQIEVVKNSFTDKFISKITEMFLDYPTIFYTKTYGGIMLSPPQGFVDTQIQRLTDTINELNAMGTDFLYQVDVDLMQKRTKETQHYLNDLHRAFTTAHRSYYDGPPYVWNDRVPLTFQLKESDQDRFLYLIDQINDIVHKTELYVKTDLKTNNISELAQQVEIIANTYINDGTRLIKECFFNIEQEDYPYWDDSGDYDVWVGTSILGKDYIIAYYEDDDAGAWDITHMLGYSAKLAIDISPLRRSDIVKTTDFQNWLAKGGVTYTPAICGMPVGRVVSGKEFLVMLRNRRNSFSADQLRVTVNE